MGIHGRNAVAGAMLALVLAASPGSASLADGAPAADRVEVTPEPDLGYLTNPGIGWQHKPGMGTPLLPQTIRYPNREDISWRVLNPAEGVFDWDRLDRRLAAAAADGKQLSFRVYTMRGEGLGGHQLPGWVLDRGATLTDVGAPDYSNCTYQRYWGEFVDALRQRYDGNDDIAFIDISGYGDFNEWSWRDEQTQWDQAWADAYADGTATPDDITTIDGQARKRLADMFLGGTDGASRCRTAAGVHRSVSYTYPGFQETQLVMPYAGIRQSTQYVFTRRRDVGFRHDCLGRADSTSSVPDKVGPEIRRLWRRSPIVFEFCAYLGDDYLDQARRLLRITHGSVVHDNLEGSDRRPAAIRRLMTSVGYRFGLRRISYPAVATRGEAWSPSMRWANVGSAPNYPAMGQTFDLHVALVRGDDVVDLPITVDTTQWLPPARIGDPAPGYDVTPSVTIPSTIPVGSYSVQVAVTDRRTGRSIALAIAGRNSAGRYPVGWVTVS